MTRRSWNNVRPTSLNHALELCVEFARVRHNRSVDNIADLMGLPSKWVIYKYIESGKLPANQIRPFEHACGCNYVTQWVASSNHKLLIDYPTGSTPDDASLLALNSAFNRALDHLRKFAEGSVEQDQTEAALRGVLEQLAWHHGNIASAMTPQFDLEDSGG